METGLPAFLNKIKNLFCAGKRSSTDGYVKPPAGSETLPQEVFTSELEVIRKRRAANGLEATPEHDRLDTSQALAGLALSGGGIRSATFNLGVIQRLQQSGLFDRMDFLSTVSGGGYIGSCLSSVFSSTPELGEIDLIITGLPKGVTFTTGTPLPDQCWRIEGGFRQILELHMTDDARYQPHNLHIHAVRRNAPAEQIIDNLPVKLIPLDKLVRQSTVRLQAIVSPFPFHQVQGQSETESLQHLRDSSNYLKPRKFLSSILLPGLFIRGLITNSLVILPFLLLASILTVWTSGNKISDALHVQTFTIDVPMPVNSNPDDQSPAKAFKRRINIAKYIPDNSLIYRQYADLDNNDKCYLVALGNVPEPVKIIPNAILYGNQWVIAAPRFQDIYLEYPAGFSKAFSLSATAWIKHKPKQACKNTPVSFATAAGQNSVGGSLPNRHNTFSANEAVQNPVQLLSYSGLRKLRIALAVTLMVLTLFPVIQGLAGHFSTNKWASRDILSRWLCGGSLLVLGIYVFVLLQPLAVYYFHVFAEMHETGLGDMGEVCTVSMAIITVFGLAISHATQRTRGNLASKLGLKLFGLMGPLVLWLLYLNLTRWILLDYTAPAWLPLVWDHAKDSIPALEILDSFSHQMATSLNFISDKWLWDVEASESGHAYLLIAISVFLFTRLFYDVNDTSLHWFYRDRLSKAYLFNPWRYTKKGRASSNDAQKLSTLSCTNGPYHIINTTMNVQRSRKANVRGRNGVPFIFSRNYSGSQLTGYRQTKKMEDIHGKLTLATAMAISGAAASPNMGRNTLRSLVFIMTMLNIRLGYWFPNPGIFAKSSQTKFWRKLTSFLLRPFTRVTPYHLILEMTGNLKETGWHVNLTDGGHLENMGLYELIRRRCKLIVVCDAEADPDMTFEGLGNAVRLASIDFGVTIDIDVGKIRPLPDTGTSQNHYAIGRIDYGAGEYGYLIYLKSSLTGDEGIHIQEYHSTDPTFPQQTTADQFFDEDQFEAYRALGAHVASSLLAHPALKGQRLDNLGRIITGLEKILKEKETDSGPLKPDS